MVALNLQTEHLIWRELTDEHIQQQMAVIWQMLKSASESHERCFDYFAHPPRLSILQERTYVVTVASKPHSHSLSRLTKLLDMTGDVLRRQIFETDWSSRLRRLAPLAESLNPLPRGKIWRPAQQCQLNIVTVAAEVYSLVKLGAFRRDHHHVDGDMWEGCRSAFAQDLGPYSYHCEYFLGQAVRTAIQLHFQLLHPRLKYEFDMGEQIEALAPAVGTERKGSDWRQVFPSLRCGSRTVVPAEVVEDEPRCDRCSTDLKVTV